MRVAVLSESLATLGGGEKHGLMLVAPLLGRHDVTILHRGDAEFNPDRIRERFNLNFDGARVRRVHSGREVLRIARDADLFVNITYASIVPNLAKQGILLVFFPVPLADHPPARFRGEEVRQALLARIEELDPDLIEAGPSLGNYRRKHGTLRALLRLPLFALRKLAWTGYRDLRLGSAAVRSYTHILANSRYTAACVERFYGRTPRLCFPPIDTRAFQPGEKRNEILAVGRFDDGENSKQFQVLIEAFRRGSFDGWTLHICGGTHGSESEAYLARLRNQAAGVAVEFHPNLPFRELVARYACASAFWHAMGHGVDAATTPWRCEHFGMSTAEAMSAGCIPFVVNAGGLTEIVTPGSGFLWNSLEELLSCWREFQALPATALTAMRAEACRRAGEFGHRDFYSSTVALYDELGIACRSVEELLNAEERA